MKCEAAGIPFTFYDHMPTDEVLAMVGTASNYKGIAATVDINTGSNIGEYALAQKYTKAIVVTGETTDTTHSARTNGFTRVFENGGGTVLTASYGPIDLSSVMTRANDVLTAHPDVQCIYATNGDVGATVIEALAKHPEINAQVFVTDLDPAVLDGLQDGTIAAANGAHWVNVNFATALLVNSLKGNEIRDEAGNAPRFVVPVMTLPSNMVDLYNKYWIQQPPFSDDELRALVGPNVTIRDFQNIFDNYNIESRLQAKIKAGLLSQEEFDAAKNAK